MLSETEKLMDKRMRLVCIGAFISAALGICYLFSGFGSKSWWLLALGCYYCILGLLESVILSSVEGKRRLVKFTGWALILLSVPLGGIVALSLVAERGHRFSLVSMLAIAVLAFVKITLATVNLIKSRNYDSEKNTALRSVLFVDGLVSIFALQRSMLVTFGGMTPREAIAMNLSTGLSVWIVVFLIGVCLVIRNAKL